MNRKSYNFVGSGIITLLLPPPPPDMLPNWFAGSLAAQIVLEKILKSDSDAFLLVMFAHWMMFVSYMVNRWMGIPELYAESQLIFSVVAISYWMIHVKKIQPSGQLLVLYVLLMINEFWDLRDDVFHRLLVASSMHTIHKVILDRLPFFLHENQFEILAMLEKLTCAVIILVDIKQPNPNMSSFVMLFLVPLVIAPHNSAHPALYLFQTIPGLVLQLA